MVFWVMTPHNLEGGCQNLGEIITFVFHLEDGGNKMFSETLERSFKTT
jgi:hypothetical protein